MPNQYNVVTYLTARLKELGIKHLFSVPGDYTSDLLEIVDTEYANDPTSVKRVGNCNELNAGYAADGYARANGFGAVAVTTGVGSFSLLNAVGGSFVENVPVVAIIGTLSNSKLSEEMNAGVLYHHNVGVADTNKTAYAPVTVAFERISNPMAAPDQIDRALTACISKRKPVVIEILEDCYYMPCSAPEGTLTPVPCYEPFDLLEEMALAKPPNKYASQIVTAVHSAAIDLYKALKKSEKPIFWVGREIATYKLQSKFTELLDLVRAPYVNSLLGKAVIPENNPWFLGLYDAVFTSEYTRQFIDECDCLIGLGVWNTDLNEFGTKTTTPGDIATVLASRNMVKTQNPGSDGSMGDTGENLYVQVTLEQLLDSVLILIKEGGYTPVWDKPAPPEPKPMPPAAEKITYDSFFNVLNHFITPDNLIVGDIGLSTFGGTSSLKINRENGFLAQNIWASIGWSVPAGLGASFTDGTRAIVTVGDGAFKLTCQAISTMVQENRNTVVFVLNNKVYGVEQMLLNPAPYQTGSGLPFEEANILQEWDYVSLMKAFSNNAPNALSANVNTVKDLQKVLKTIRKNPDSVFLVNINLDETDYPSAWQKFVYPKS
jgi:indolepyruvate decarboxylase